MPPQQGKPNTQDSWISDPIPCGGGLVLNIDPLTLGTKAPGAALVLQNFECSVDGGYRRLSGYTKYDPSQVPGNIGQPILGVKVALGGVFAVRSAANSPFGSPLGLLLSLTSTSGTIVPSGPLLGSPIGALLSLTHADGGGGGSSRAGSNDIYFSTGAGWVGPLNSAIRPGSVTKARAILSTVGARPAVIFCDEFNPAWKYDGVSETVINGTGAPTNPKYCEMFFNSLVLAGYGDGNKVSIAAPTSDTDFNAADGALEFDVGDTITGLKVFRDTLIVFCQRYIKQVTGNGTTANPFVLDGVASSLGCLSADTIQEMGGDIIYLAADTLRSYAATVRINDAELSSVCQQIQPLLHENILNQGFTANDYSSCCIRHKAQYNLFINDPNNDQADTIGLRGRLKDVQSTYFNARNNYEWATLKGIKPSCADSDFTAGQTEQELSVIGDPSNGYVYQLESGNDFDGVPINAIYRSPDLTFDDVMLRKTFQKMTLLTKLEGNFTSTLNLILERGDPSIVQPNSIAFSSNGSVATYGGTGVQYGTAVYGQFATPIFKQNLIGSGFFGAFQFSSNDSNAPYTIQAYQIALSLKGRR